MKKTNSNNQDSLSSEAYGGVDGSKYKPFVNPLNNLSQGSIKAILIGILLAILFAASNTYLGLTAGMTVAGGIPGAILGTGMLYALFRKKSILEGNVIQSMSSGGESISSGVIFVLPAIILIGGNINPLEALIYSTIGVILAVFVIILVRKYLIIQSHGELIYPESMAISEVLVSSNSESSGKMKKLLAGASIAGIFKILGSDALNFFNSYPTKIFATFKAQFGIGLSPALIGVGYIIGIEVAFAMLAGAILASFVLVPLFGFFGDLSTKLIVFPSLVPISEMSPGAIASKYIRYIGAGAIATGAVINIVKVIPTIISAVKQTFGNVSISTTSSYNEDVSMKILGLLVLVSFVIISIIPNNLLFGIIVATLTIMCAFLFAVVGSRMTGIVGTSNLPVSGMTIASLLVITPVFALFGYTNISAMGLVLLCGTTIVVAIALSGGFAQSLKVSFILGAKTKIVQKAFIIASCFGVVVVVSLIMILDKVYGFKSDNTILIAPQANLMALIVKGILNGELPWVFISCGVFIAIMLAILRLPVMSVAIGFYLPLTTVLAIVCGGILRWLIEKKYKNVEESFKENQINNGVIIASGLIAGEAIVGLIVAIVALIIGDIDKITSFGMQFISSDIVNSMLLGFIILFLFLLFVYKMMTKVDKVK